MNIKGIAALFSILKRKNRKRLEKDRKEKKTKITIGDKKEQTLARGLFVVIFYQLENFFCY